jgi:hypothetical protein
MMGAFGNPHSLAWCAEPSLPALRACAGIAADAARLACFDREMTALGVTATGTVLPTAATTSTVDAPAAVTPTAAMPSPAAAPSVDVPTGQQFGLPAPRVAERSSKTTMIEAHIASIAERTPGLAIFTLDNGQIWRQAEPEFNFSARAGDGVTITTGLLGSYWLTAGPGAAVRVKRVK